MSAGIRSGMATLSVPLSPPQDFPTCCSPSVMSARISALTSSHRKGNAYRSMTAANGGVSGGFPTSIFSSPIHVRVPAAREYTRSLAIPAAPKPITLLEAFNTYDRVVAGTASDPTIDTLRKEIRKGLEHMATSQIVLAMVAGHGLTPWTVRRIREMQHDLEHTG